MPYNFLTRQVGPNAWGNTLSFAQLDGTLLYLSESVESLGATKVNNSATGAFATNDALTTAIAGVVANSVTTSFALSAFTSSYALAVFTGSYATTASNSFRASQTITGSLIASGSTHTLRGTVVVSGSESVTGDLTVGTNAQTSRAVVINRASGGGTAATVTFQDAGSTKYTVGVDTSNNFAIYDTTNAVNVFTATSTLIASNITSRTYRVASGGTTYFEVDDITGTISLNLPVTVTGATKVVGATTITGSLIASGSSHNLVGAVNISGSTSFSGSVVVGSDSYTLPSLVVNGAVGGTAYGLRLQTGGTTRYTVGLDASNNLVFYDNTNASNILTATSTLVASNIAGGRTFRIASGGSNYLDVSSSISAYVPVSVAATTTVTGSFIASASAGHTLTGPTAIIGTTTITGATTATGATKVVGATTVTGSFIASASAGHTLTGPTAIVGATTVTGATNVVGATTVTGSLIASASAGHTIIGDTRVVGVASITGSLGVTGLGTGNYVSLNSEFGSQQVGISLREQGTEMWRLYNENFVFKLYDNANSKTTFATSNAQTTVDATNYIALQIGTVNKAVVQDTTTTVNNNLIVSASQFLTLQPYHPLPTTGVASGSFASSGSNANLKPYFWNGASWTALF